ncbi:hypothetical protein [Motilimonas eburnea]|uniref:hypothetical protein n=1 Tax=Motilimonas eburnea TaxID=1737488 RepID=UPI001E380138|nr:hypothetical protein [Motilimonas eburnea]MCE2573508.1 hypothetical protein [Motilimonas eburnea]
MSFFKKLFAKPAAKVGRELTHPYQLQRGDLLKMSDSFGLADFFRNQQFEVTDIQTQEFQYRQQTQLTCQGAQRDPVFILLDEKNKNTIKLTALLKRADVESLFDMDDFAEIFEPPGKAKLTPLSQDTKWQAFLANNYLQQDYATVGYWHDTDYRGTKPPAYTDEQHGRQFEYFSLFGEQEQRWIEIYVFENGDTDIYLSIEKPISDITELWPKG